MKIHEICAVERTRKIIHLVHCRFAKTFVLLVRACCSVSFTEFGASLGDHWVFWDNCRVIYNVLNIIPILYYNFIRDVTSFVRAPSKTLLIFLWSSSNIKEQFHHLLKDIFIILHNSDQKLQKVMTGTDSSD